MGRSGPRQFPQHARLLPGRACTTLMGLGLISKGGTHAGFECAQTQTTALIQSQRNEKGWLTSYNLRHNYTSPWRLSEGIQQGTQYLTSLQGYEASIRATLAKYFPSFVVEEWVEEKVGTIQTQLQSLLTDAESLQGRRVWERRPLATSITTNTSTNRQSQKLST